MYRNSYNHAVMRYADHDVLVIEDNGGRRSLTNDIEKVVADISWKDVIDPAKYIIVYRDSAGRWDGWSHAEQAFIITSADTWEQSVNAIISFKNRKS